MTSPPPPAQRPMTSPPPPTQRPMTSPPPTDGTEAPGEAGERDCERQEQREGRGRAPEGQGGA